MLQHILINPSTNNYVLVGCRSCGQIFKSPQEEVQYCYNPFCKSRHITVLKNKDLSMLELDILSIENDIFINSDNIDIDPLSLINCHHYTPMITITGSPRTNKYLGDIYLPGQNEFPLILISREKLSNNKVVIKLKSDLPNTFNNISALISVALVIRNQLIKAVKKIIYETAGVKQYYKNKKEDCQDDNIV